MSDPISSGPSKEYFNLLRKTLDSFLSKPLQASFHSIMDRFEELLFTRLLQAKKKLESNPKKWLDTLEELRQISVFEEISVFDLFEITEHIKHKEFIAGDPFILKYQNIDGVYLIPKNIEVKIDSDEVSEERQQGVFGEEGCFIKNLNATYSASTATNCIGYFVFHEDFLNLSRMIPGLRKRIWQSIVSREIMSSVETKAAILRANELRVLTQEVLDNMGQGTLSINVAGEIGPGYNAISTKYLDRVDLSGFPFADIILQRDRQGLRNYYRALHMLFSGNEFDPEMVIGLLPNEVKINNRDLKLSYSFIRNAKGFVTSVFVRLEDVTKEKERERLKNSLNEKEEKEKRILANTRQNIRGFSDLLDELKKIDDLLIKTKASYVKTKEPPSPAEMIQLLRDLHGLKGLSGQFEFDDLKNTIHELEDVFREIEDDKTRGGEGWSAYDSKYGKFKHEFEYAWNIRNDLGEQIGKILQGTSFEPEEFERLCVAVKSENLSEIKSIVLGKSNVPAEKIVDNWEKDIKRLAGQLGKNIAFKLSPSEGLTIPKQVMKELRIATSHLYRNCIDHGIETPEQREIAKKPEEGVIAVKISGDASHLTLVIEDDGTGLDEKKIVSMAKINSHLDQKLIDEYIQNDQCWKILFLPGFSSAKKITAISGRGVGLDAVQTTVNQLNGTISWTSTPNVGSSIKIEIPITTN